MKCYFASNLKEILNIENLPEIGKGTDGIVYRYNKLALKLLKYDNKKREEYGRLNFEKASYFVSEIDTTRIAFPQDILLDENGIYVGIVMEYLDVIKQKNLDLTKFNIDDLLCFMEQLTDDFDNVLTPKQVVPKDINFGSYCMTPGFIKMCDVDKYCLIENKSNVRNKNKDLLNYTLAKAIYYLDFITNQLNKEERKKWQKWVKQQVKEKTILKTTICEKNETYFANLEEYLDYKRKKVLGL